MPLRSHAFRIALLVAVALSSSLAACKPAPPPATPRRAPPPEHHDRRFDESPADLDALVTKETTGYTEEGAAVAGNLETFAVQPFVLQRGKCYRVVLRLGPDASFSDHAKKAVSFVFTGIAGAEEVIGGPGIAGPGGVGSAGCPHHDAPAAMFDLRATSGSARDKSKLHELGHGSYTLQLYSKAVSDAELSAMAADEARQEAATEAYKKNDADQRCGECRREKDLCLEGRRAPTSGSCTSDFDSCRFRSGITKSCN